MPSQTPLLPLYLPFLFPKKTGDALDSAKRNVKFCYAPPGEPGCWSGCFKILHVTVHPFPREGPTVRRLILLLLGTIWLLAYPRPTQMRSLLAAVAYTGTESLFTWGERGLFYTSGAQFFANLLYTPILLDAYAWSLLHRRVFMVLSI